MENIKLYSLKNPKSGFSESFKSLRTSLQFSSRDKKIQIIVVTSPGRGEGKTTIASNLALSFAQSEKKVLLVDCNMRKPTIHEIFDIPNEKGLTNILLGEGNLEDVVHNWVGELQGLNVVTCGPIPLNPSEILGSDQMKKILEDVRKEFDMVIIDTPAINSVTDGVILSALADGTIMVVELRRTDRDTAKKGKKLLESVHANIIGVVLNKVPTK